MAEKVTEDEDDFMSDKFLVGPSSTLQQPTTYSDQRKRKQLASHARSQKRSRAEREIEARTEGLSRDLIAEQLRPTVIQESKHLLPKDPPQPSTHSKAVQMMLKMGYKPGKALGLQDSEDPPATEASPELSIPSVSGNKPMFVTSHPPSTAPIEINLRTGRAGIGVCPPAGNTKPRHHFSGPHVPMTEEEATKRANFFEKSRAKFDGRKLEGVLSRARRTCEELDRRHHIENNVLWLDPYSTTEPEEDVMGSGVSGRRLTGLNDPGEFEKTVVTTEDEENVDPDEREAWLALDSGSRLLYTLQYLRQEYW